MANKSDTGRAMSLAAAVEVLKFEREYQYKRWGYHQPDGTFKEAVHDVCDYIVYCRHYLQEAMRASAKEAGLEPALCELRKVATLVIAYFEQKGLTFDVIIQNITDTIEEYQPVSSVNYTILELGVCLTDAADIVLDPNEDGVDEPLYSTLAVCIACFTRFGVPMREPAPGVTNQRDGLVY